MNMQQKAIQALKASKKSHRIIVALPKASFHGS